MKKKTKKMSSNVTQKDRGKISNLLESFTVNDLKKTTNILKDIVMNKMQDRISEQYRITNLFE